MRTLICGASLRGLLAAAGMLAGCGGSSPSAPASALAIAQTPRLEAAEKLWLTKRPVSYHIHEQRSCECLPQDTQEMIVFVTRRQGATVPNETETIVRATYASSGAEVGAATLGRVRTVQQLFALIRDAIARSAARVDVTYDPTYGFPTQITIDYDAVVADDEFTYWLSGLVDAG